MDQKKPIVDHNPFKSLPMMQMPKSYPLIPMPRFQSHFLPRALPLYDNSSSRASIAHQQQQHNQASSYLPAYMSLLRPPPPPPSHAAAAYFSPAAAYLNESLSLQIPGILPPHLWPTSSNNCHGNNNLHLQNQFRNVTPNTTIRWNRRSEPSSSNSSLILHHPHPSTLPLPPPPLQPPQPTATAAVSHPLHFSSSSSQSTSLTSSSAAAAAERRRRPPKKRLSAPLPCNNHSFNNPLTIMEENHHSNHNNNNNHNSNSGSNTSLSQPKVTGRVGMRRQSIELSSTSKEEEPKRYSMPLTMTTTFAAADDDGDNCHSPEKKMKTSTTAVSNPTDVVDAVVKRIEVVEDGEVDLNKKEELDEPICLTQVDPLPPPPPSLHLPSSSSSDATTAAASVARDHLGSVGLRKTKANETRFRCHLVSGFTVFESNRPFPTKMTKEYLQKLSALTKSGTHKIPCPTNVSTPSLLHRLHLPTDYRQRTLSHWSVNEIYDFVVSIPGLDAYAQIFRNNEIDGDVLSLLDIDNLVAAPLNMKIGPAVKLFYMVKYFLQN